MPAFTDEIVARLWKYRLDTVEEQISKAWDESKHKRHGKGSPEGGRFTVAPKDDIVEGPEQHSPIRGQQELPFPERQQRLNFQDVKPGRQPDSPRDENPLLDRLGDNAQPIQRGPEPPKPQEPPKPDPEADRAKAADRYQKDLKERAAKSIAKLKPSAIHNAIREVQQLGPGHAEHMKGMYAGMVMELRNSGAGILESKKQDIYHKSVMWEYIKENGIDGIGQGTLPDVHTEDSDGILGNVLKKKSSQAIVKNQLKPDQTPDEYHDLSDTDFANLAWGPINTKVAVEYDSGQVNLSVVGKGISMWRTLHKEDRYIKNEQFFIKESGEYKGEGTEIFAQQVLHASEQGYEKILTSPGRSKDMNGYYTWFALGYDADVQQLESSVKRGVRRSFPKAETVQDVFDSPAGKDWWLVYGDTVDDAVFDLTPGSRSMKILTEAVAKRRKK